MEHDAEIMNDMNMNLNELAAEIHRQNHRWWHDKDGNPIERNRGELLMLVITELAEACEGIRKDLMDDKLPHRKMEEVEMADGYIRLLDFAGGFTMNIKFYETSQLKHENRAESLLRICRIVSLAAFSAFSAVGISESLALIREYCSIYNLDLTGAVAEKLAYNRTRLDHTHEARRAAGGKRF
jgi:hypothetical protein